MNTLKEYWFEVQERQNDAPIEEAYNVYLTSINTFTESSAALLST